MDSLFGEGQSGLKVVLFVIVVLGLLALAFWLLRRFGGGGLGSGGRRGREGGCVDAQHVAGAPRRRGDPRPAPPPAMPRVPLGENSMWPLQPEPAPPGA